jgi:hypothetical protein
MICLKFSFSDPRCLEFRSPSVLIRSSFQFLSQMYATCLKTNQAVLVKSFIKQKTTEENTLFSIVPQILSLSLNRSIVRRQSSLFLNRSSWFFRRWCNAPSFSVPHGFNFIHQFRQFERKNQIEHFISSKSNIKNT